MIKINISVDKSLSRKEVARKKIVANRLFSIQQQIVNEADANPEAWLALEPEWLDLEVAWRLEMMEDLEKEADKWRGGILDRLRYKISKK